MLQKKKKKKNVSINFTMYWDIYMCQFPACIQAL